MPDPMSEEHLRGLHTLAGVTGWVPVVDLRDAVQEIDRLRDENYALQSHARDLAGHNHVLQDALAEIGRNYDFTRVLGNGKTIDVELAVKAKDWPRFSAALGMARELAKGAATDA